MPFGIMKQQVQLVLVGAAGTFLLALLVSWWLRGNELRTCELTTAVADQMAEQRDATLKAGAEAFRKAKAERDAALKSDLKELSDEASCRLPADACDRRVRELYEQRAMGAGAGAR